MKRRDLERLKRVVAVKSDASMSELRQMRTYLRRLSDEIDALDAQRSAAAESVVLGQTLIAAAIAHEHWRDRNLSERGELNIRLAAAKAEAEAARAKAARAVGEDDVVRSLLRRTSKG